MLNAQVEPSQTVPKKYCPVCAQVDLETFKRDFDRLKLCHIHEKFDKPMLLCLGCHSYTELSDWHLTLYTQKPQLQMPGIKQGLLVVGTHGCIDCGKGDADGLSSALIYRNNLVPLSPPSTDPH